MGQNSSQLEQVDLSTQDRATIYRDKQKLSHLANSGNERIVSSTSRKPSTLLPASDEVVESSDEVTESSDESSRSSNESSESSDESSESSDESSGSSNESSESSDDSSESSDEVSKPSDEINASLASSPPCNDKSSTSSPPTGHPAPQSDPPQQARQSLSSKTRLPRKLNADERSLKQAKGGKTSVDSSPIIESRKRRRSLDERHEQASERSTKRTKNKEINGAKGRPNGESPKDQRAEGRQRDSQASSKKTTPRPGSSRQALGSEDGSEQEGSKQKSKDDYDLGSFTAQEKEAADRVFEAVRIREHLSVNDMKMKIQSWTTVGDFKKEVLEALPRRPVKSVRQFCRRRYHNLDRGPWTPDQDDALRRAYAQVPDQWSKISKLVGRTGQDCRDRWRGQVKHADVQESGPWAQQEEERLKQIVDECIRKIEQEFSQDSKTIRSYDDKVHMVNWHWVSNELGNTRSEKRCREKFAKLRLRDVRDENTKGSRPAPTSETSTTALKPNKKRGKRDRALEKLDMFELGDYYDVFEEIHTSFSDHTKRFHDEDNTPWTIVSEKHPDSRFSANRMQGMLRRVAFERAMTDWTRPPSALRKSLKKAPTIAAQAFILTKWIESQDPDNTRQRKYLPGWTKPPKQDGPKLKKVRKEARSEEYVVESDDGDDDDDSTMSPDDDEV